MKDYRRLYEGALLKLAQFEEQLGKQATELASLGRASFEVRAEDSQNLAEFKATNTTLVEFVEKVADSKSKFGTEAKRILGR